MKSIRNIVRAILGVRDPETIKDSLDRKKIKFSKLIYKKKYDVDELKMAIKRCGIDKGDVLLVHSAWRNFYNFQGKPDDAIDALIEIVGVEGAILMPNYGSDKIYFDIDNTPSCAGVISEVFRNRKDVKRSQCSHFPVASWGNKTDELIEDHKNSIYGFDKHSPCFKITQMQNSKVLFLGLGKTPSKVSIFHCAGWSLRLKDQKLKNLYGYNYDSFMINSGYKDHRHMVDRLSGHGNKDWMFRKVVSTLESYRREKISNLDIVSISASDGFKTAKNYIIRGQYFYKNMDLL